MDRNWPRTKQANRALVDSCPTKTKPFNFQLDIIKHVIMPLKLII